MESRHGHSTRTRKARSPPLNLVTNKSSNLYTIMNYGDNNYSTNSYGGGGGAGGGGFVNNYSGSQGGGASQQTPGSVSRTRGTSTLRPVTIKQILEAVQPHPETEFRIDDLELAHITFVAQIRNISVQATNITYIVEDGTGIMEVKRWIDTDSIADDSSPSKLAANQYIRVIGTLKPIGGKRHVGAHQIHAITDFNEVQYHLLEAAAIHLHFTRGPPEQFAPAGSTEATTPYGQPANIKGRDTAMGGMGGVQGGAGGTNCPPNASMTAKRVFDAIRSLPQNNDGIHTNIISQKSGMAMPEVLRGVDELLTLGVAYTTTDDSHIAVMDF